MIFRCGTGNHVKECRWLFFCVHFTTSHGRAYYIGSFAGTCILEVFTLLRFAVTVRCNQLTLLCHSQHLKVTPFLHAVFNLVKVQGQPQLNLCTQVRLNVAPKEMGAHIPLR